MWPVLHYATKFRKNMRICVNEFVKLSFIRTTFNFSEKHGLVFYDIANLDDVVATHEVVDPGKPGVLCSAGVSTLLYVDTSKSPHEVCWLDCSTSPPKPAADKQPIHLQPDAEVNGMCWVNSDGKQYVVYAPNTGGIFAYNTALNRIEWDLKEIPTTVRNNSNSNASLNVRGITTDGRGFIFCL